MWSARKGEKYKTVRRLAGEAFVLTVSLPVLVSPNSAIWLPDPAVSPPPFPAHLEPPDLHPFLPFFLSL